MGVITEFVKRGFVATLFGGLYPNFEAHPVINLIHLYSFIFLFIFPLALDSAFTGQRILVALVYSLLLTFILGPIKVLNHYLHGVFDDRFNYTKTLIQKRIDYINNSTKLNSQPKTESQVTDSTPLIPSGSSSNSSTPTPPDPSSGALTPESSLLKSETHSESTGDTISNEPTLSAISPDTENTPVHTVVNPVPRSRFSLDSVQSINSTSDISNFTTPSDDIDTETLNSSEPIHITPIDAVEHSGGVTLGIDDISTSVNTSSTPNSTTTESPQIVTIPPTSTPTQTTATSPIENPVPQTAAEVITFINEQGELETVTFGDPSSIPSPSPPSPQIPPLAVELSAQINRVMPPNQQINVEVLASIISTIPSEMLSASAVMNLLGIDLPSNINPPAPVNTASETTPSVSNDPAYVPPEPGSEYVSNYERRQQELELLNVKGDMAEYLQNTPQIRNIKANSEYSKYNDKLINSLNDGKYRVKLFGKVYVVIFSRRELDLCFDRQPSWIHVFASILLIFISSFLAMLVSSRFQEISLILFWFVVATCHYSLLKSVQPDPASARPLNDLTPYSRSFFIAMFCALILVFEDIIPMIDPQSHFSIYFLPVYPRAWLSFGVEVIQILILTFPLFVLVGIFPAPPTFFHWALEQLHIHIFGGSGSTSILGICFLLFQDIVVVCVLVGVLALSLNPTTIKEIVENQNKLILDPNQEIDSKVVSFTKGNIVLNSPLFSLYCGFLVSLSFWLSRQPSEIKLHRSVYYAMKANVLRILNKPIQKRKNQNQQDSMSEWKFEQETSFNLRVMWDLRLTCLYFVIVSIWSLTGVLSANASQFIWILAPTCIAVGWILHYLLTQFQKYAPFQIFSGAWLPRDYETDDSKRPGIQWHDSMRQIFVFSEQNVLYPMLVLAALYESLPLILRFFYPNVDLIEQEPWRYSLLLFFVSLMPVKILRSQFCNPIRMYWTTLLTLFLIIDYYPRHSTHYGFLVDLFIINIVVDKLYEFYLKISFAFVYSFPSTASFTGGFLVFMYLSSVPHTIFFLTQSIIGTLFSLPLNPFFGSVWTIISYARPLKFWERSYSSKRLDQSNTKLADTLNGRLSGGALNISNLNSIFYEQLAFFLRANLADDVRTGFLGQIGSGDVIVLTNDFLTCLVHFIEVGNGFVSYQVRGIEFQGTYCQEQERAALDKNYNGDAMIKWLSSGIHNPIEMVMSRLRTWQVMNDSYRVPSYSIIVNPAQSLFNSHDSRKAFIKNFVMATIYYASRSDSLSAWLSNPDIYLGFRRFDEKYADIDPRFTELLHCDYDSRKYGVSVNHFFDNFGLWIEQCLYERFNSHDMSLVRCAIPPGSKFFSQSDPTPRRWTLKPEPGKYNPEDNPPSDSKTKDIFDAAIATNFFYALSLVARRCLILNLNSLDAPVSFLQRFFRLFRGDIRPCCDRDDWVLGDSEGLLGTIGKAIRLSLKLHQDFFSDPTLMNEPEDYILAIDQIDRDFIICSESDPLWRRSIINQKPHLLSLRLIPNSGHRRENQSQFDYRIVTLNTRFVSYRVIRVNKESVRAFWSSQQQELVFLGNQNSERGSIQNVVPVIRNICNSSSDLPIGYPIYVSELITSISPVPTLAKINPKQVFSHISLKKKKKSGDSNVADAAADDDDSGAIDPDFALLMSMASPPSNPFPNSNEATVSGVGDSEDLDPFAGGRL